METISQDIHPPKFSIKLWPPSHGTRLMLVERMTKNLSTESIFSRKYGLLTKEEASLNAKQIEETGFAVANDHYEKEPDGDGSSAVQLYAKETSKCMLETLKRGPRPKVAEEVSELNIPTGTFDISGGHRAFVDAQEAEQLLRPLTEKGNLYTRIRFSNRSFGVDAARIAEPILFSLQSQLTEVDLSDFVAGRPEEEALEVMRIFSSALEGCVLRYLNLSDNALGEKGVRAFGALLKSQNSLEELYLMNDGISEEAAKSISELIPSTEKLKVLHFHNNMTGDDGAMAISDVLQCSSSLEDFRCSSTRVDSEGGIALAEALKTCTNLRKLDLRDNMFGVDAGKALGVTFENLVRITEVYLSYLNLEDDGTIAICKALQGSTPSLEVLEIAGNDITVKAALALSGCVAVKQCLKKLNLSENELMDEGAIMIGEALRDGHLQLNELDVSSNSIRRVGARCLAQAIVCKKPHFCLLNINGNAISEEGIDEVKEILKSSLNSIAVLGPLDENDAEGEGEDEEEECATVDESELESKLQHLTVEV